MVANLAGVELAPPLDGFTEELDHPRCTRFLGRLGHTPAWRDGAYLPGGRHMARKGAYVAVFKRPLGPEGDLNHLFVVGGHRGARVANLGEVEDSEPYLGVHLAVSRAGHLGSHIGLEPPKGFGGPVSSPPLCAFHVILAHEIDRSLREGAIVLYAD